MTPSRSQQITLVVGAVLIVLGAFGWSFSVLRNVWLGLS